MGFKLVSAGQKIMSELPLSFVTSVEMSLGNWKKISAVEKKASTAQEPKNVTQNFFSKRRPVPGKPELKPVPIPVGASVGFRCSWSSLVPP